MKSCNKAKDPHVKCKQNVLQLWHYPIESLLNNVQNYSLRRALNAQWLKLIHQSHELSVVGGAYTFIAEHLLMKTQFKVVVLISQYV